MQSLILDVSIIGIVIFGFGYLDIQFNQGKIVTKIAREFF